MQYNERCIFLIYITHLKVKVTNITNKINLLLQTFDTIKIS